MPKEPTLTLLKKGSHRGRSRAKTEPKPSSGKMVPPKYLNESAKGYFKRIAANLEKMGLATPTDTESLAILAGWLAVHEESVREAEGKSLVSSNDKSEYMNPIYQTRSMATKAIIPLLKQFGMTPSARADISLDNPGADDDLAAWEADHKADTG